MDINLEIKDVRLRKRVALFLNYEREHVIPVRGFYLIGPECDINFQAIPGSGSKSGRRRLCIDFTRRVAPEVASYTSDRYVDYVRVKEKFRLACS